MIEKTPRAKIPQAVRRYVLSRDNHQCKSCGRSLEVTELQIDHIVPISIGGTNDLSNLQTLCKFCNQRKCNRVDTRFDQQFAE